MKNKSVYIIIILCLACTFIINGLFYSYVNTINKNNYKVINNIMYLIESKYGSINKEEIINIINTEKTSSLKEYGINEDDFILISNENSYMKYLYIINITLFTFMLLLLILYIINKRREKKNIVKLTNLIKEINNKNYMFNLDDTKENEFSLLMNELYKTMVILKESAENSNKDKLSVKESIEDISHQLKTPLTSINIMLDNLIQNKFMKEEDRYKFLRSIKREISNINSLILILLKLASFDSNTVVYNRKQVHLIDVVNKSIQNLTVLIDLKDINISLDVDDNTLVYLDFNMEVEAITNIIKNAIEYTKDEIIITSSDNKMYTELTIKDNGRGLDKNEIEHIFERFYKGNNYKENSFGIGLSLAKAIITKDNGKLDVSSVKGKYTIFKIRYFKNIKNVE